MGFIAEFLLKKRMKELHRIRSFHNFNTAKSVGIIFNAATPDCYVPSRQFIQEIIASHIQVKAMGLVDKPEAITNFPHNKDIDYTVPNKLDWRGLPKDSGIEDFINSDFDILIDISLRDDFVVKYMVALSKAKFKINRFEDPNLFDLRIHTKYGVSTPYYIDQIKQYLSALKLAV